MKKIFLLILFLFLIQTTIYADSWKNSVKGWQVIDDNGNVIKNSWYKDKDGAWYLINEDGYLVFDKIISQVNKEGKKFYYLLSQDSKNLGQLLMTNSEYYGVLVSFDEQGAINLNNYGIQLLIKTVGKDNYKEYNSSSTTYSYNSLLLNKINNTNNNGISSGGGSGGGGGGGGSSSGSTKSHKHTYSWEIINEATETKKGVKLGTCTICGYQKYVYGSYDGEEIDIDGTEDEIDDYIEYDDNTYTYYIAIDNFVLGTDKFVVSPYKLTSSYKMTVAQAIQKLAEIKDFTLINNNSFTNGWYLSKIKKNGIGPQTIYKSDMPECLRSHINKDVLKKTSATNILGEKDYTHTSGWLFSVNGEYGMVGMGAYELEDEDVLRLTYTICDWGADIGGWGAYYDYAFLTDEIKQVANGDMSLSSLVNKAKKLTKEA